MKQTIIEFNSPSSLELLKLKKVYAYTCGVDIDSITLIMCETFCYLTVAEKMVFQIDYLSISGFLAGVELTTPELKIVSNK